MASPLFRAFLSRLFTSACGIATAFVSFKLYSLYLTKEIYGVIFVSTQFLGYLPLTGAGFLGVINQRVLTAQDRSEAVKLSWFAQFLQNCIFMVMFVVAMLLMAMYTQTPLVKKSGLPDSLFFTIGLVGALTLYVTGQISFLVGLGEQAKSYLLTGSLQLLTSLLLFLAFAARMGAWAIPVSGGLAAVLFFLPLRHLFRTRMEGLPLFVWKRQPDYKERFLGIWRPALDNFMTQGWSLLTFSLDAILVGLLVGPGQAAVYGIVTRLTFMSRHVLQALGEIAWPRLAQHKHPELKAALMRKVDRLNAWNVGTWFGAMFATAAPFLAWFLKADWVAGTLVIALVLARHAVISLAGPHVFGIVSLGLFRENAIVARREVFASVIPAVILCHFWGTLGIAGGYLLGGCMVSGWQLTRIYFRAQHKPWVPEWWAIYWRGIVGAALGYSLGFLFWHLCLLLGNGKAGGWLALPAGGLAFGLAWAATGGMQLLKAHRASKSGH